MGWAGTGGPCREPGGLCRGPGGLCKGAGTSGEAGTSGGAGASGGAGTVTENMKDSPKRYSKVTGYEWCS